MSHGANDLAKLAQARENILLAEVAGLLHDVGKFCDRHYEVHSLANQSTRLSTQPQPEFAYKVIVDDSSLNFSLHVTTKDSQDRESPSIYDELTVLLNITADKVADYLNSDQKQSLLNTKFELFGETFSLAEMILIARPKFARPSLLNQYLGKNAWLIALLGACHREAHYDKQEPKDGQQEFTNVRSGTSFGFESSTIQVDGNPGSLTARLRKLPFNNARNHQDIRNTLKEEFTVGLGDTRRPINEVDLWSWSSAVASLFKAEIANALLTQPRSDLRTVKWRLLRVSYDGLAFLERAPTVGDMLGRHAALTDALDRVRTLLEYTYPLGNEVYRDEHGSAFVVPALDGDDNDGNLLRGLIETHILDAFRQSKLRGELEPHISISKASKEANELHTLLQDCPPPLRPFTDAMQCWWQGEPADICTTCGVRPQGWGAPSSYYKDKAKKRNVCYVCLERRSNRAEVWATGREEDACDEQCEQWQHTIWTDEVADKNGRLALVVGHFDLDEWLSGEMIQTMLVVCDQTNNNHVSKNPSFARIQRVWRTTQQFWKDVWKEDVPDGIGKKHARLEICVGQELDLGLYHAYDTEVDGRRLSVVWDKGKRCLITADNLHPWGGAERLKARLEQMQKEGKQLSLSEPGGYGQQRKPSGLADITGVHLRSSAYTPAVKLLSEPRSFLALVPAAKALEVANRIRERYEREMSKVRNRMPMFLGLVFFGRRQPLFSALDAGRRMLDVSMKEAQCTVEASVQHTTPPDDDMRYLQHDHFKRWLEITLKTKEPGTNERYVWRVSTVMGDGKTEDDWYPYANIGASTPQGYKQFSANGKQWLHVECLQPGQIISFTPAHFAYIHLDTSARRFEVGTADMLLPLEELERISRLWEDIKQLDGMSESKLHAVASLLKMKRDEWGEDNTAYEQLIRTVFSNERMGGLLINGEERNITNRLLRTFEIYQQILKEQLPKQQTVEENQE